MRLSNRQYFFTTIYEFELGSHFEWADRRAGTLILRMVVFPVYFVSVCEIIFEACIPHIRYESCDVLQ
jgi:hypothetical protein